VSNSASPQKFGRRKYFSEVDESFNKNGINIPNSTNNYAPGTAEKNSTINQSAIKMKPKFSMN
jgi:hypothetical protein